MSQFILIVNGPIAGGKTFAIDAIMRENKKVFRVSANKIKFLISDYTPDRDRALVQESVVILAGKMLGAGMSLVVEGGSVTQGNLNKEIIKLGEKLGVKVTTVNVEAPLEVLKSRFVERVENSKVRGSKLSVKNDEDFMKRYNAYLNIRSEAEKTFDSSLQNQDEIAKGIMAIV